VTVRATGNDQRRRPRADSAMSFFSLLSRVSSFFALRIHQDTSFRYPGGWASKNRHGPQPPGKRRSGARGHSSGGRWRLGAISKRGDTYLRTLLIGGARSVLLAAHRTKRPHRLQAWALEVERRRGRNRAAIAVANKLARIVWAVSTRGVPFHPIPLAPQNVPA
jgi:hypothetical protein